MAVYDVSIADLEAEWTRTMKAFVAALVAQAVEKQTGEITEEEQPDPRDQGVHTGGGRNGGPYNPRM